MFKKITFLTDHIHTENLLCDIMENFNEHKLLIDTFKNNGIILTYASIHHYNKYFECFSEYIEFNQIQETFLLNKTNSTPDLIWLNTKNGLEYIYDLIENDHPIFPNKKASQYLCDNYVLYLATKTYQKPAILLDRFANEKEVLELLGDNIIIKPIRGIDENGIDMMNKKTFLETFEEIKNYNIDYLFLVQDNIDKEYQEGDNIIGDKLINAEIINGKIVFGTIDTGHSPVVLQKEDIPVEIYQIHENIMKDLPFLKTECFLMQFGYSNTEKRWYFVDVDFITVGNSSNQAIQYSIEKYKLLSNYFKNS